MRFKQLAIEQNEFMQSIAALVRRSPCIDSPHQGMNTIRGNNNVAAYVLRR